MFSALTSKLFGGAAVGALMLCAGLALVDHFKISARDDIINKDRGVIVDLQLNNAALKANQIGLEGAVKTCVDATNAYQRQVTTVADAGLAALTAVQKNSDVQRRINAVDSFKPTADGCVDAFAILKGQ